MDWRFSESQEMLRKTAREFLEERCPKTLIRAMETDAVGYSPELWRAMADLGWLGLPFPQKYGGVDGTILDLAILSEEQGRALAPVPFQSSVVQFGLTILLGGSEAQRQRYLPAISNGELIASIAHLEPRIGYEPQFIKLRAEHKGAQYVLNGTKVFVDWAHVAKVLLVLARTGPAGADEEGGLSLFLVPSDTPGIRLTPMPTLAEGQTFEVAFNDVRIPAENLVGALNAGWSVLKPARQRAIVCKCAEMTGGASAAFQMSLQYAKQRHAFGRPIGGFQLIQDKLISMVANLDTMWVAAYYAAWRLDEGLPSDYDVSIAKAQASKGYREICVEGHEIHAGIGFFREHDLQLYYRRSKMAELEFGDSRYHWQQVTRELAKNPSLVQSI